MCNFGLVMQKSLLSFLFDPESVAILCVVGISVSVRAMCPCYMHNTWSTCQKNCLASVWTLELSWLCLFVVIWTYVNISTLIFLKLAKGNSWISFWFLNCGIILKWYLPGSVRWNYRLTCWRSTESTMVFCSDPNRSLPTAEAVLVSLLLNMV
jgi:hypothetical protein